MPLAGETAYLEAFAAAVDGDGAINAETEETALLGWLMESAIAENKIAAIKTDAEGNSRVKQLPVGDYYLFGYARFDDEIFVWNLPLKISGESVSIEVDQYYADAVISTDPPNYFAY